MRHYAGPEFWAVYGHLPKPVQAQADRSFERLKANQRDPSLKLKRVGRFWSVRIGLRYRALAVAADGDLHWFWIGSHSEYDRLIL